MFLPISLEKQVEEATFAVETKFANGRVFKNQNGDIMTEYSFDVLDSYNLDPDDLDSGQLKITMPGGTFEGITSTIDGAPQFSLGEKSFLLLKKIHSRIYISNFSLGKFKIQEFNGKTYFVSEVFPMDQHIGRISKEKMIDLIKSKWKITSNVLPAALIKSNLILANKQRSDSNVQMTNSRNPAQEKKPNEKVPVFFWITLVLVSAVFGITYFKLSQMENKNKKN
jgi:hypothetical protein